MFVDLQSNKIQQHVRSNPTNLPYPRPPPPPLPTELQGSEKVWRGVFMGRFGLPSKNQETAHKLAGSWLVSRQMLHPTPSGPVGPGPQCTDVNRSFRVIPLPTNAYTRTFVLPTVVDLQFDDTASTLCSVLCQSAAHCALGGTCCDDGRHHAPLAPCGIHNVCIVCMPTNTNSAYLPQKEHRRTHKTTPNTSPLPHPSLLPCLQALYKSKVVTDQAAGQWRKPCPHELQAALHTMIHTPPRAAAVDNTGSSDTISTPQPASPATAAAAASVGGAGSSGGGSSTAAAAAARGASLASDGGDSPARQSSSSSSEAGSSLSSSNSIDSCVMNNEGLAEGKTRLSLIFLLDSSGSVGDGEYAAVPVAAQRLLSASAECCVLCSACGAYWVE